VNTGEVAQEFLESPGEGAFTTAWRQTREPRVSGSGTSWNYPSKKVSVPGSILEFSGLADHPSEGASTRIFQKLSPPSPENR